MKFIDGIIGYPEFDDIIFVAIIIAAIFIAAEKIANDPKRKISKVSSSAKMYTGGEDLSPGKLSREPQSFYSTFINTFKLAKMKNIHDGDLTQYLYWMFGATMVILVLMVLL